MAKLVEIIGMTHNPFLPRLIKAPNPDPVIVKTAKDYDWLRQKMAQARPDVLIVVASDHLNQWFMDNMPAFLVGKAPSTEGPAREQAATCLAARGIRCVIAASFSQTYKRNAFNNALLVIDSPDLYGALRARLAGRGGATIPGPVVTINLATSRIAVDGESFALLPVNTVAQELIVAGGAEKLVQARLR